MNVLQEQHFKPKTEAINSRFDLFFFVLLQNITIKFLSPFHPPLGLINI